MKAQVIFVFLSFIAIVACNNNTNNKTDELVSKIADTCTLVPVKIEKESEPYTSVEIPEFNGKVTGITCDYYQVEFSNKQIQDKINDKISKSVIENLVNTVEIDNSLKSVDDVVNSLLSSKDYLHRWISFDCVLNNNYILALECGSSNQSIMGESPMSWSFCLNFDLTTGNTIDLSTEVDNQFKNEVVQIVSNELKKKNANYSLTELSEYIFTYPCAFQKEGVRVFFDNIKDEYYLPIAVTIPSSDISKYFYKESVVLKMWNDKNLQ
jgi:hypothetical protein